MKRMMNLSISTLLLCASNAVMAAQVCNENLQQTTPNSRFELSGDEATDKRTGLTWKRCILGQTWNQDTSSCDGEVSTKNWLETMQLIPEGWRIPNIKELTSITEYSCANPTINTTVFPNTPTASFWSSTVSKKRSDYWQNQLIWAMNYQDGTSGSAIKNATIYTRLVKATTE